MWTGLQSKTEIAHWGYCKSCHEPGTLFEARWQEPLRICIGSRFGASPGYVAGKLKFVACSKCIDSIRDIRFAVRADYRRRCAHCAKAIDARQEATQ